MSLSGVSIIFESERTSFPWYQWSFIEYFLLIVSLFKIVGIRFTLLSGRSLFKTEQAIMSIPWKVPLLSRVSVLMVNFVCYKLCKPIVDVF